MPSYRTPSLALALICQLAAPVGAQEIQWRHDYESARREAREKNRPLVIDFGTSDCTWCKKLDASTFRDAAVVKQMNEQFVALKIDAEVDKRLASDLQIKSFPTLVFAAPDGKILGVQEGFVDAAKFGQQLRRAQADAVAQTSIPAQAAPAQGNATQSPPTSPPVLAVRITAPPLEAADPSLDRTGLAQDLAAQIKNDPALAKKTAEKLAEQLGELYLGLAENALTQNLPHEAVMHLERVLQVCPGSAMAQAAQQQLDHLQSGTGGLPSLPQIRAQSK